MARVHPQDSVDVQQAARREATYACEFVIDAVEPANLAPIKIPYSSKELGEKAIADKMADGPDAPLSRLAAAVVALQAVTAKLAFAVDEYDRPVVTGEARAEALLPCQRCLEEVPVTLVAPLHSVVWLGAEPEAEAARELALGEADLIVSPTVTVPFAVLVEDDLLLALPERVCLQDDCARAPALTYPAPGSKTAPVDPEAGGRDAEQPLASDRQLPFAGLRELLDEGSDS